MIRSIRCLVRGTVQGVGFRPWIYRLAAQFNLKGFVRNTSDGACIEIEGASKDVEDFLQKVHGEPPLHCAISQCLLTDIQPQGFHQFQILSSLDRNQHEALILPDMASCSLCLKEVFDPNDRRYLYPFTNCTHCGPRYSIIEALPYDRINTSMKKFIMCEQCQTEYDDPLNRRFHAQPNACPVCGPKVALLDALGGSIDIAHMAVLKTVEMIKQGRIVAVKALGGFYLMADALNEDAVSLLRQRKSRPHKPFALMMPSLDLTAKYCYLDPLEAELIQSAQAPIVLLRKAPEGLKVAESVAPQNPYLGCMLPSMPLLHIFMKTMEGPVVATSGNLSDEPICIDNVECLERLKGIADFFLVHDRSIIRHVDDSIMQVMCNEPSLLRRARGFAPLPVDIGISCDGILTTGAHQKNTVALGLGASAVVSQHIGDLDAQVSYITFEETVRSLKSIYDAPLTDVVCDAHPDYISTRFAHSLKVKVTQVQHHHAHVASSMAEWGLNQDVLGVCWDGTGYGLDGTIWGGECLLTDGLDYRRFAHLNLFALPGGEQAVKEPRRSALGLLHVFCNGNWQEYKDLPCVKAFSLEELTVIQRMITQKINSPQTSSMGRLFDGIASMVGLCHQTSFEGQAAMALEYQVIENLVLAPYCYKIIPSHQMNGALGIDWSGIIQGVIEDFRAKRDIRMISTRFHQTLIEIIVDLACQAGQIPVILTGGCFQNKWLTQKAVDRLKEEGFKPYWHKQIPANDGGISLGQMFVMAKRRENVSGRTGKN
ncbi:MAG: carbamoyltransferase HypF [Candidatus Omnitrophica bacterium]|nr:carbamoyltransferase HypF [Candidatus Omnitrophota bacterium]